MPTRPAGLEDGWDGNDRLRRVLEEPWGQGGTVAGDNPIDVGRGDPAVAVQIGVAQVTKAVIVRVQLQGVIGKGADVRRVGPTITGWKETPDGL